MSPDAKHLSVVIPTFNEAARIQKTLAEVSRYLERNGFDYEIIVADDGSRDGTLVEALKFTDATDRVRVIDSREHRGKGFAVRQGVLAASKPYVLYADADLAIPIQEVEKLLAEMARGCQIAIGSKHLPASKVVGRSLARSMMGRTLNLLVRLLLLTGIRDTQCGFKCLRREVARDLFGMVRTDGFGFDIEMLCLARRKGYRVSEVPVTCIHRGNSSIKPVRDSLGILRDVWRIRFGRPGRWQTP